MHAILPRRARLPCAPAARVRVRRRRTLRSLRLPRIQAHGRSSPVMHAAASRPHHSLTVLHLTGCLSTAVPPSGRVMKLKRFLLRYYPPGIILEYEQNGEVSDSQQPAAQQQPGAAVPPASAASSDKSPLLPLGMVIRRPSAAPLCAYRAGRRLPLQPDTRGAHTRAAYSPPYKHSRHAHGRGGARERAHTLAAALALSLRTNTMWHSLSLCRLFLSFSLPASSPLCPCPCPCGCAAFRPSLRRALRCVTSMWTCST